MGKSQLNSQACMTKFAIQNNRWKRFKEQITFSKTFIQCFPITRIAVQIKPTINNKHINILHNQVYLQYKNIHLYPISAKQVH